jgi:hypothetical protein
MVIYLSRAHQRNTALQQTWPRRANGGVFFLDYAKSTFWRRLSNRQDCSSPLKALIRVS